MELTAKDATILTLITARPSTSLFEELVQRLDDPAAKAVAERIREGATGELAAPVAEGPAERR